MVVYFDNLNRIGGRVRSLDVRMPKRWNRKNLVSRLNGAYFPTRNIPVSGLTRAYEQLKCNVKVPNVTVSNVI